MKYMHQGWRKGNIWVDILPCDYTEEQAKDMMRFFEICHNGKHRLVPDEKEYKKKQEEDEFFNL